MLGQCTDDRLDRYRVRQCRFCPVGRSPISGSDHIPWLDFPDARRQWAQSMQFQLARTARMAPRDLERLQLEAIRRLLIHAVATVPYFQQENYTEAAAATTPEAFRELFFQLPLIRRADIQQNRQALQAKSLTEAHGSVVTVRSSGSTGRPIEVVTTQRAGLYWESITLRDHLWNDRDFSKTMAVIKHTGGVAAYPGRTAKQWGRAAAVFGTGPSHLLDSGTPVDRQWRWLDEIRPDYLVIYPSLLQALAEINAGADQPLDFAQISTIGENLTPEIGGHAEAAFSTRVCDIYSAQEVGYMALKCPFADHYHIQSESCLLEVLDDDGSAVSDGIGRVAVTPLHNYAMPLIRYQIGDYAEVLDESCAHFSLPVLKRIIGRERNLVRYPDRAKSWPSYNPMALMDVLGGARFQLRQPEIGRLILRYVADDPLDEDRRQRIGQIIQQAMNYPFAIDFEKVDDIARSAGGKYEEFVCELADD